jgi:hypothetical protein
MVESQSSCSGGGVEIHVSLSDLSRILGLPPVRSELVYMLVRLDKEYVEKKPDEAWEVFYARGLLAAFGTR